MTTVAGLPTSRGLVAGPVFLYRGSEDVPVAEYTIAPDAVDGEIERCRRARLDVRRDLESLISVLRERTGRSDVMVFECHLMLLEDPDLCGRIEKLIVEERLNAEAAVRRVTDNFREQFSRMNDPYFRERVRDIDDLARRMLSALTGRVGSMALDLKSPAIIVADDLTPSETVQLPREYVLGFATNGGSKTSHVALLARAMAIPAVTGLGDITTRVEPGMVVLLDGGSGTVTVNPDAPTLNDFRRLQAMQREISQSVADGCPAGQLREGGDVPIYANLHPGVDTEGLKELGARGVGLYRSEYLWLNGDREPSEELQFAAYREAAEFTTTLSPDATLTIRTLDIGGDKVVKGISAREQNPFLGNRSIRYLLSQPQVFRTQLRAILRASAFGRVRIMHPMVSCIEELHEAAEIYDEVKHSLRAEGVAFDPDVQVGVMIEIPAAAVIADVFAAQVDFFSIGTNDLVQYTMAADRSNEAVAHLYQPLNPAVLRLMRMTISAAKARGLPISVCGESASDPIIAVLWAAMGIDHLSMSGSYIPVIARILRRLSRAELDELAAAVEASDPASTADDIYALCRAWLERRIPDLDRLLI